MSSAIAMVEPVASGYFRCMTFYVVGFIKNVRRRKESVGVR